MNNLDRVLDGVTHDPNVKTSTARLMHNIAGEIRTAIGNPEAEGALADMLDDRAAHIGDHVLAATPVIGSPLPTQPVPAASESSKIMPPRLIDEPVHGSTGATGPT